MCLYEWRIAKWEYLFHSQFAEDRDERTQVHVSEHIRPPVVQALTEQLLKCLSCTETSLEMLLNVNSLIQKEQDKSTSMQFLVSLHHSVCLSGK